MKRRTTLLLAAAGVCVVGAGAFADVAVVIPHPYTVSNDRFSCFDYNPYLDPDEFYTTGYGFGKDLRWSQVLDDTVEPWALTGGQLMNSSQIEFFARDGYAAYSLSFNSWGMAFNPLDEKFFIGCISILRDPYAGNVRVATERDLIMFDPRLPNGENSRPSGVTVSNTGGEYLLVDSTLADSNGFVASGVEVGHQLTLYPLWYTAEIYSGTYRVEEVIDNNTLRLDRDPLWAGSGPQSNDLTYILQWQPWLTLQSFRDNIAYYFDNPGAGPKAHNRGGFSPDGLTYYVSDIISDNILAVDTQQPDDFTIFASKASLSTYVQSLVDSGRRFAIYPDTDNLYRDAYWGSGWTDESVDTAVNNDNTSPTWDGSDESISITFNSGAAVFRLHTEYDLEDGEEPRDALHYTNLEFYIHGGASGGQMMEVNLWDDLGNPGDAVTVTSPAAGTWSLVQVPVSSFNVATIGDFVLTNTAGDAQPEFFVDQIDLVWVDPLPDGVYEYDTEAAGPASAQLVCDADGRVLFSEGESDDLLWTADGQTFEPFLTSPEILSGYLAAGALDLSEYYGVSNKVQVLGLAIDPMGTVYWADNQTRSIWKAPANDPANNIIEVGPKSEIMAALLLSNSPRGLSNFVIRGHELLTFNFVDSNTVYKVDLDTQDYGDLDADFDADLSDFAKLQRCMGADLTVPPEEGEEDCTRCDVDYDEDVDLDDFAWFEQYLVGPPTE